ncbi:porin [Roseomonas nepalensis]|uniref:Porin n=1 Tax=Muricoccus nepalensis TaxID=1854500 RepID=A0A502FJN4_9PROT|nr:porin [Roseomonas nepalensis]TPG49604.1 porin [Roseomonas nepalensis]
MRKLLLGSTAVAAAALFAPTGAMAQGVSFSDSSMGAAGTSMRGLEVRIGGYYRAMYNYTNQTNDSNATTRLGKSDFTNEIEIHILASGKAANGLQYGVALEIENDAYRQPQAFNATVTPNQTYNSVNNSGKNTLAYDEAWAYLAGSWGQIRFGDEDGAVQQLQSGHITGFGVGGLDSGDQYQQVVGGNQRGAFSTVNDPGDNTKLIYLSPQFLGFDAGGSFSFNTNDGANSGCDALNAAALCDRTSALNGQNFRRRNEIQAALRWRGAFGPVGLTATIGYYGADSIKNTTGFSPQRLDMVWAGVAATAYGFTVGGWYTGGSGNANFATKLERSAGNPVDSRNIDAFLVGATYTIDAITIGGHYLRSVSAGAQTLTGGTAGGGGVLRAATGDRTDTGFAVGGNYRIAPGLDFFAEYLQTQRKEAGFDFVTGNTATAATVANGTFIQRGSNVGTVLAGFRVAF